VEGPVCNIPHTESMGAVIEEQTNVPSTSDSSYACPQVSSLPPETTMTPPAPMPAGPNMGSAVARELPGVHFATGSASLTDAAIAQIDYFTYYNIIATPTRSVRITGFADEQGSAEANKALSARRAQAVASYMATKGVPRSRMTIVGAGATPGGWESRRVDILAE